jgi:tetratricopeptide (TPR) repeat protein
LHWADSASLQFLHYLLRNTRQAPILVLGTYREVSLVPTRPFYEKLVGLNRERLFTRLALHRLDLSSARKLVNVLLDNPTDPDLVDQIYQETAGNPFFIEEVIKSLVGRKMLHLQDGFWLPVDDMDLHVPQSIQIAVGKRIANLSDNSQILLKHASILGQAFNLDVLIEMTGQEEDSVLDALEEAEKAQLIRESERSSRDNYRFEHALMTQVLVDGTSMRRQARLHQKAGEAIEKVFSANLEPVIEKLAYHFSLAPIRVAEKAISYGLLAAEKAVAVYAHNQALHHYTQILELLEELNDPIREAQIWEMSADTNTKLNFHQETIDAYDSALASLEKVGEAETLDYCRISYKLADSLDVVDPARARQLIHNALSNQLIQSDKALQAKCMAQEVYFLLSEDDAFDQALELGQQSLALANESKDQKAIAVAWGSLKRVYQAKDEIAAYTDAVEQQISALGQCNDYFGVFGVFFDGIHAYYSQGDIKGAERLATSGLDFCRVTNAPGWEGTILANYLWILYLQGRWSEALDHAEPVLPLFQQAGLSTCFVYIFMDLAFIESGLGHFDKAEEHVESMLNLLLQFESVTNESETFLVFRFIGFLALGRWQDAWKVVERAEARDFHPRSTTSGSRFLWAMKVSEVAARVGRYTEAESMARDSLAYFEPIDLSAGIGAANFGLGLALAGQEKWGRALSSFEKALTDFQNLKQPFDSANTLHEMGLLYLSLGEDRSPIMARQSLEKALNIYQKIEASPSIKRTQDLLTVIPVVER